MVGSKSYHVKRIDRQILDEKEIDKCLQRGQWLSIALIDNCSPYIVTLSYGYDKENSCIYFHGAKEGRKLDCIRNCSRACATYVKDLGYVDSECEHNYESIVIEGNMFEVESLDEKKHAMRIMMRQLESKPSDIFDRLLSNDNVFTSFKVLRLDIANKTMKRGK